jgi:glycosyltransferase involved in cell wall biosynthesis
VSRRRRRTRTLTDPVRVAHLTTIDASLLILLGTELELEAAAGLDVLAMSAPGPNRVALEALQVEVVDVPHLTRRRSLRADAAAVRDLWRLLPGLDLDVLHTHTPKAGIFGRIVGRLRGVPVVVNTCHGLLATREDPWPKRAFVYGVEGLASRFSHAELFQNAEDLASLRFALRRGRAEVVGNGVDLERFAFDPEARAKVRAELGVTDDELLVGGVGRRVAAKGLFDYAAAAQRLSGRARFMWVGPDEPDKADAVHGQLDGVELLGQRDDMPAVYAALDVFVLPSYREGLPRSAMEAAACGRPLVLTDIRGSRELGTDGVEVAFVPPGDPAALAATIGRLLDDAPRRSRLGEAALRRAIAEFDQRDVARASVRAYWTAGRRKGLAWPEGPPEL